MGGTRRPADVEGAVGKFARLRGRGEVGAERTSFQSGIRLAFDYPNIDFCKISRNFLEVEGEAVAGTPLPVVFQEYVSARQSASLRQYRTAFGRR